MEVRRDFFASFYYTVNQLQDYKYNVSGRT